MFVVEQNANIALGIADRAYVLEAGSIVLSGSGGRTTGQRRGAPRLSGVLGGLMILAFPGVEDNFFTLTLFLQNLANAAGQRRGVRALMALTVVMIYKTTGHLNFAQGEMAMFTTFVVFALAVEQGWPVWLAIGVVVIVAMFVGGVRAHPHPAVGEPQRARPVILTLGLFFILNGGAATIWGTQPRTPIPAPFPGASTTSSTSSRTGSRTSSSPTRRWASG